MFTIQASPETGQAWAFCCDTIGRSRNGSRSYQNSMSDDAYGKHGVARESDRESQRLHPSKKLKDHVARLEMRYVTKRTGFMVKQKTPRK